MHNGCHRQAMKVNIYGVGRSGTKAVQLYIAYLLARKFVKVWVNYEPSHWKDRKANSLDLGSPPQNEAIYERY